MFAVAYRNVQQQKSNRIKRVGWYDVIVYKFVAGTCMSKTTGSTYTAYEELDCIIVTDVIVTPLLYYDVEVVNLHYSMVPIS